jgi:hypothetical protein
MKTKILVPKAENVMPVSALLWPDGDSNHRAGGSGRCRATTPWWIPSSEPEPEPESKLLASILWRLNPLFQSSH